VSPFAIDGFAGVTAIEASAGPVTVSVVFPVTLPDFAVIVEVPTVTPVATPPVVIVATAGVPEVHVTLPVITAVLLSEYVAVATNAWVRPFAIDGLAGVTAIDANVGPVTVSVVPPLMGPDVAVIVDEPTPTPVAKPPVEIVATPVADELHVTLLVMTAVLLSEYVPVAVYCCVVPLAIEVFEGATAIDFNVGAAPVPDRLTDCGLPAALSVTVMAALRAPVTEGVNETFTVQNPPVARVPGMVQLLFSAKSPRFAPVRESAVRFSVAVPLLVMVKL